MAARRARQADPVRTRAAPAATPASGPPARRTAESAPACTSCTLPLVCHARHGDLACLDAHARILGGGEVAVVAHCALKLADCLAGPALRRVRHPAPVVRFLDVFG